MKLHGIRQHPGRFAAAAVAAGLFFAAGTTAGSAAGSEGTHSTGAQTHTDVPLASAADADTLWHYLGTLPPDARARTIIALNPNVTGALEAIIAGNIAAAVPH